MSDDKRPRLTVVGSDTSKPLPAKAGSPSVDQVLDMVRDQKLDHFVLLSELEDGTLVFFSAGDMELAQTNWLLDRTKRLLVEPDNFELVKPIEPA